MRAPPDAQKAKAALAGRGSAETTERNRPPLIAPSRRAAQQLVASIGKSPSLHLRVLLTEWRGQHKIELRDYSAVIADCFFPAGVGVSLDITKLPTLIEALKAVEAEATKLGLLP